MRRSTFHQRSVTYLVKYLYKKYEKKLKIYYRNTFKK